MKASRPNFPPLAAAFILLVALAILKATPFYDEPDRRAQVSSAVLGNQEPVEATVAFYPIPADPGSHSPVLTVQTSPISGSFWARLDEGTYRVLIKAPGFQPFEYVVDLAPNSSVLRGAIHLTPEGD